MQFSSGAEAESGDTTSPRRSWHSTHFNVVFESGKDNENLRSPSFSFLTLAAPLDDDTAKHADNKGKYQVLRERFHLAIMTH